MGEGELLFNGDRVSVLQDESEEDLMHDNENILNTTDLHT